MTTTAFTGVGLVLPCGEGLEAARRAWEAQESAFAPLPPELGGGRGAACGAFDAGRIPMMLRRRMDRASRFAWVAAQEALAMAGLDPARLGGRLGLAVGTCLGGFEAAEAFMAPWLARGELAPALFPNALASCLAGNLSLGLGITGPAFTQVGRENACFAALDQAALWLGQGTVDAVLLVGADALFPLLGPVLDRAGLRARGGGPGGGFLPGEGAQAFVLERRRSADARDADLLAEVAALASASPLEAQGPSAALGEAALGLSPGPVEAWISGASGLAALDRVEAPLRELRPDWPEPGCPKRLWGEFCGSGGQLLAAALLEEGPRVLVTAPASAGPQYAALLHRG